MKIGMLWYDPSSNTLEAKLQKAATYYREKHHLEPNLAMINPNDGKPSTINGIQVKPTRLILKNHIWIGQGAE